MEQYTNFAKVYDLFMDNVPYDKWVEQIKDILYKENIKDGLICDLGCGTGAITERLANLGYDMIGLMLQWKRSMLQAMIYYIFVRI